MKNLRRILRNLLLKKRCYPRWILEKKIFPSFKNKKILLVGVASYTKDYPQMLKDNEVTTIDLNPYISEFGAQKHITGDISKIELNEKFDIIIMFGVLNWGLDYPEDAEKALENCHNLLNKGGLVIIGWNPYTENHNKINPRSLKNFRLFQTIDLFGIGSGNVNRGNFIFEFLMKRDG